MPETPSGRGKVSKRTEQSIETVPGIEATQTSRCGRRVRTVMFLLGAVTRGYLRTALRIAISNVPLCPPHVYRNRAGESALDAVFAVGDTHAGQSETQNWTCSYSCLARHAGQFTGPHVIKRSEDDATRFGPSATRVANADQLTQPSPSLTGPFARCRRLSNLRSDRAAERREADGGRSLLDFGARLAGAKRSLHGHLRPCPGG